MARTKRTPNPPATELELVEPDRLTAFFEELGAASQSVTVSVYEIDEKDRNRRSFLFKLDNVEALSGPELMAEILTKHGAGEYMAEGRDVASGQIVFQPRFRVGSMKKPRVEIPPPQRSQEAPPPASSSSSELAQVLANQSRMLEAMLERLSAPVDPFATIKQLAALREAFGPPAAAAAPALDLASIIKTIDGVLSLREKFGEASGGGDDGPLGTMARMLGPALTKLVEQQTTPQPAQRMLPPPSPVQPTTPQPAAEGDDVPNALMLKLYVGELVRFAEQKQPPLVAVERVRNTLSGFPVGIQQGVLDWLNDENAPAKLAELEPKAAAHAEWLGQVIDGLLEAFGYEADDTPAPAAEGDAANGAATQAPAAH